MFSTFRAGEKAKFIVLLPAILIFYIIWNGFYVGADELAIYFLPMLKWALLISLPFWSLQGRTTPMPWGRILILLIVSGLYFLSFGIHSFIGKIDLDAILFHLKFGIAGFDSDLASDIFWMSIAAWVVFSATAINHLLRSRFGNTSFALFTIMMIVMNPMSRYGVDYLGYQLGYNKGTEYQPLKSHYQPAPDIIPTKNPKNVIFIYMEGLERTYNNNAFGGVYSRITDLAKEGVEFTNIAQISSTGWSIAGMVATQCGIPLFRHGLLFINHFLGVRDFLPNTTCLGDQMSHAGYKQVYLASGDAAFAGISTFYKTHGGMEILDVYQMPGLSPNDRNPWGMHDAQSFERARQQVRKLEAGDQPYNLIVQTVGPHDQMGYLSKSCRKPGQGGEAEDILEAVECTGNLSVDFVNYLRETVDMDNTLLVLMSDHLAHGNNVYSTLEKFERRNSVIFFGAGLSPGVIDKPGSMIDIFPTVLEVIGTKLPNGKAGLGVSMFSDHPSLLQMTGLDNLNRSISFDRHFAKFIWEGE